MPGSAPPGLCIHTSDHNMVPGVLVCREPQVRNFKVDGYRGKGLAIVAEALQSEVPHTQVAVLLEELLHQVGGFTPGRQRASTRSAVPWPRCRVPTARDP